MTKRDLLKKFNALLEEKGMNRIQLLYGNIGVNSTKNEIQSGIDCLSASDNEMNERLEQFKNMYPAIYKKIIETDFLTHSFNRYYVYLSTKM